jgi:hypothetical protein
MFSAARYILVVALGLPGFSQQVTYSLYNIPVVGHPTQFQVGVSNASPGTMVSKIKNNYLQLFIKLDGRFSATISFDEGKKFNSIHIGFDDQNSKALSESFFVRETGEIFRVFRKPAGARLRIQTRMVGGVERPVFIEFVDDWSIGLTSNTSTIRMVCSILPYVNGNNYLLRVSAGSRISLAP